MIIAAVDPGACTGFAILDTDKGSLWADALGHDDRSFWLLKARFANSAIVEKPMIYPKSKARPNDVVTLAVRAGEAGGRFGALGVPVRYETPSSWKGQVPKNIHHARLKKMLTPAELGVWEGLERRLPESKFHNVADAIGLALFAAGRK